MNSLGPTGGRSAGGPRTYSRLSATTGSSMAADRAGQKPKVTPMMVEAYNHPNIETLTYAEVDDVSGYIGNFQVKIRRKQTYVDWNKCTGCGDCAAKCPSKTPDEFNMGLSDRRAAFQAVSPEVEAGLFLVPKVIE